MNNKEKKLLDIVDIVVSCCATEIGEGVMSVTKEDVLSKSREENVVMTRCILCSMILLSGYSKTTISQLLHRSIQDVRHLIRIGNEYFRTSAAYRFAEEEARLKISQVFSL